MSNDTGNKRIAKNTAVLYTRMLLTVGISFYTTRLILQHLGVSDYTLWYYWLGNSHDVHGHFRNIPRSVPLLYVWAWERRQDGVAEGILHIHADSVGL